MPDPPFLVRVGILLLFMGIVVAVDYRLHRENAKRLREYSLLLACAVAGGAFGAAFDQYSMAVSPEYFHYKGIAAGPMFRADVTLLGFRAGFLVGAVAAGLVLWAGRGMTYRRLLRMLGWVPVLALLGAPIGRFLAPRFLPRLPDRTEVELGMVDVLGMHVGLYLGAIAGIVIACLRARQHRITAAAAA